MIISNIVGGLGNQMFQYACGRATALRLGVPLKLTADQFPLYHLHNGLEIDRTFAAAPALATPAELSAALGWQSSPRLRKFLGRPAMLRLTGRHFVQEPHFEYWDGIRQVSAPAYLHGYWQSERYFAAVQAEIRSDFRFSLDWDEPDSAVRERMARGPSVSVHVRRGDYATKKNQSVYAQCGLDYYRAALRHVRERVPGVRIFLFSDEPAWAESNLSPEFGAMEIVRHNSGSRSARDMRLMSEATHHVIANSSFSWWGAWLDASADKIVVAPRHWFVDRHIDDRDLVPSTWVRL